jgi:hypothetical protein
VASLSAAAHIGKGLGTVLLDDSLELCSDLVDGLLPGDPLKGASYPLQRILQSVGVVLVIGNVQPFPANVAFTSDITLVPFHLHNAIILYLDFQPAVLCTQDATGFIGRIHDFLLFFAG